MWTGFVLTLLLAVLAGVAGVVLGGAAWGAPAACAMLVLRRRAPEQVHDSITLGELLLDGAAHRELWRGQPLQLGPTELRLLHFLMKHAERVHSRGQLLDKVWGDHVFIEERTVDVHIKRLRESLGEAAAMVETVRGAGYRFTAQPVAST